MTQRLLHTMSPRWRAIAVTTFVGALIASAPCYAIDAGSNARSRIVAIGGSVTEIVYALGRDDSLIAVDTTSVYPPQALKTKASIGYLRALSPEGILAVQPTHILALPGAGPANAMAVVKTAGIPLTIIPDVYTGDGILAKVRAVASALRAPENGECLAAKIAESLAETDAFVTRMKSSQPAARVLFVLSLANGKAMVAGSDTAASGILKLAGARNALPDMSGYKAVSDEAIVAANPDAILVMSRAGETITADQVFAMPAFRNSAAAVRRRLITMDGQYLLGFGPRTAFAARDLAAALYAHTESAPLQPQNAEAMTCAARP